MFYSLKGFVFVLEFNIFISYSIEIHYIFNASIGFFLALSKWEFACFGKNICGENFYTEFAFFSLFAHFPVTSKKRVFFLKTTHGNGGEIIDFQHLLSRFAKSEISQQKNTSIKSPAQGTCRRKSVFRGFRRSLSRSEISQQDEFVCFYTFYDKNVISMMILIRFYIVYIEVILYNYHGSSMYSHVI
jgi:hypothetical protein